MKTIKQLSIGVLLIATAVVASEPPKTLVPVKVPDSQITGEPYRFNGVVLRGDARASGFCAWDRKTFFSSANFVFNAAAAKWAAPPVWNPLPNSLTLDSSKAIQSRGYYRWRNYSMIVAENSSKGDALARDVILGFAFKDLIEGPPAILNLKGVIDLKSKTKTMITGYPYNSAYTGEEIPGFFLHQTGPGTTVYQSHAAHALEVTLVSTGDGNIGGPIWTKDAGLGWTAAGVLVRGLPSESVVCAFASDINSLTRAVDPVVHSKPPESNNEEKVSATSRFFGYERDTIIPDGVQKWTEFPMNVNGFEEGEVVKSVTFSMKLKTPHQGDLMVTLAAPGGYQEVIHNEEGGGTDNLKITDRDVSEHFRNINPKGKWKLLVQDRLAGDVAKFKSCWIEITTELPPPPPPSGGTP